MGKAAEESCPRGGAVGAVAIGVRCGTIRIFAKAFSEAGVGWRRARGRCWGLGRQRDLLPRWFGVSPYRSDSEHSWRKVPERIHVPLKGYRSFARLSRIRGQPMTRRGVLQSLPAC